MGCNRAKPCSRRRMHFFPVALGRFHDPLPRLRRRIPSGCACEHAVTVPSRIFRNLSVEFNKGAMLRAVTTGVAPVTSK